MYEVWEEYFNDIPRKNFVLTKFGKYSKRQLGCIKYASEYTKVKTLLKKYEEDINLQDVNSVSIILLTKYFMSDSVPEFLLISTLSHEICHYAHGFHSPLERKYKYPHKGGVVTKEMQSRGLGEMLNQSEEWLKENWIDIIS
ncbi:MAG: hypothetical protein PHP08_01250 [Candidatus Dojkabacteria bacterium]|nr:hypothetical protein [Candidatus Dojkabacteria bacterium]